MTIEDLLGLYTTYQEEVRKYSNDANRGNADALREVFNLERELLEPIIMGSLEIMKSEYKPRPVMLKEHKLYGLCRNSRQYATLYPEYNIGNVNVFMSRQNEEFKNAFDLFCESIKYMRQTEDRFKGSTTYGKIVYSWLNTKYRETYSQYNVPIYGKGNLPNNLFDKCFATYMGLKMVNEGLVGKDKYLYMDQIKSSMFGLSREYVQKSFIETFYVSEGKPTLTDTQARKLLSIRKAWKEVLPDVNSFNATEEQFEMVRQQFNKNVTQEGSKIHYPDLIKWFMSYEPSFIKEQNNIYNIEQGGNYYSKGMKKMVETTPSQKNLTVLTTKGIEDRVVFKPSSDDKLSYESRVVIEDLATQLAKETFKNLSEADMYALNKRRMYINKGYKVDMAEKQASCDVKEKYDGKITKFKTLLNKVYGEKSNFSKYITKMLNSDELPKIPEISKDDLVLYVAREVMVKNISITAEVCGLDLDEIYKDELEEMER